MASLLRQIVAGPRARHTPSNLDLCYVTPHLIATSGPSGTYPQRAYRNPLPALVAYLDATHGDDWAIWEFRAEGTGYPDSEVHGRVWHFPWPDHHPPPFGLVPRIVASMREWRAGGEIEGQGGGEGGVEGEGEDKKNKRVLVVHCKAGKGRSGTVSCAYLMSEEGWTLEDAIARFTARRMRPGFGAGVSIPSQLRWLGYVDRWVRGGKVYVERQVEVLEVHVWGLRDGVKVSVEGFVDEGKVIKNFHTFKKAEREVVRGGPGGSGGGFADVVAEVMGRNAGSKAPKSGKTLDASKSEKSTASAEKNDEESDANANESSNGDVIFRPASRVVLPTADVNIDFERRNKPMYGYTMVTSVAHVWFNTFFEGGGPEACAANQNQHSTTPSLTTDTTTDKTTTANAECETKPESTPAPALAQAQAAQSGVFEIAWDKMDGIKGSQRKGTRAFDKMAVVWRTLPDSDAAGRPAEVITEPGRGEEVKGVEPADWRKGTNGKGGEQEGGDLGIRKGKGEGSEGSEGSGSGGSVGAAAAAPKEVEAGDGPASSTDSVSGAAANSTTAFSSDAALVHSPPQEPVAGVVGGKEHVSTGDLPGGLPEGSMQNAKEHTLGHVKRKGRVESSS